MSDAQLYHEELLDQENQLETNVQKLETAAAAASGAGVNSSTSYGTHNALLEQYNKCQAAISRLQKTYAQYRMELRLLDGTEQETFHQHGVTHQKRMAALRQRVEAHRAAACASPFQNRTSASANADGSNDHASNPTGASPDTYSSNLKDGTYSVWSPAEGADSREHPSRLEARGAAGRIQSTQHETLKSLGNTERLLCETETTGQDAATTLRKQTEQIEVTHANLEEMDSDLHRAGKELKGFMRRMARDRIIIFFCIAIVCCLIAIVILAVLKHTLKK